MKTLFKAAAALALVLVGALASGSAMADHYGRGWGGGWGHEGHFRFGITFGVPLYGPAYYPGYYPYPAYAYPAYAYPPVVVQSAPPVYVERDDDAAPRAPAPADWYYCPSANAYYPYVNACPGGWQRVPARPAPR